MNKKPVAMALADERPVRVACACEDNKVVMESIVASGGASTPSDKQRKVVRQLIEDKGQPFLRNDKGKLNRINEPFWAALVLIENHLLWEPREGQFYLYEEATGFWKECRIEALQQLVADRLLRAARHIGEEGLERFRQLSTLNAIITHIKGQRNCPGIFDGERRGIHFKNGILKIHDNPKGLEFLDFSPHFLSRNQSPITYDKMAICPRFLNELLYPALEREDAVSLQKYVGQCIFGINRTHKILVMHGAGAAGKTTLTNVIIGLIGKENIHELHTQFLGNRFELGKYVGKSLLIGSDVNPDFLRNKNGAEKLKSLVGGDRLNGEKKCLNDNIPIQGQFNVIINCNQRLTVNLSGDETAWHRRLLILEFKKPSYRRKIDNFAELLLREEASGILNWALDGLLMLLDDIQQAGDFVRSEIQLKRIGDMLGESDSVRHFIQNCLVRGNGNISKEEFKEAYVTYCVQMAWIPMPPRKLSVEMDEVMMRYMGLLESRSIVRHGVNVRGFSGVTLRTETQSTVQEEVMAA